MPVLWGVDAFVRMGVFLKMQYARVRMNASTTYEGMFTRGRRR